MMYLKLYEGFLNKYSLKSTINKYLDNFFKKYDNTKFSEFRNKNISTAYSYHKFLMIVNYSNEIVHIKDALTNIIFESTEFDKFINYFDNYIINYYGRINVNSYQKE